MNLQFFLANMDAVDKLREQANVLWFMAKEWEEITIKAAGLTHTEREPGFPCWSHPDSKVWYNTAEEAMRAVEGIVIDRPNTGD
jgi:hypothetical protein